MAAALAVSGCRDEHAALTALPGPEPAGAAGADQAGPAVAAADSTETEECDPIRVEIKVEGGTETVYLCRREAAGGSASADGAESDGTQICWYKVLEIRIGGVLVSRTEEFLFCEPYNPPTGGGGADPEVTLKCDTSPERGSMAACAVTVADDDAVTASELVFDWASGFTTWSDTMGTGGSDWSGVATDDAEITVTVTGGGIAKTSKSAKITVTARSWARYGPFSGGASYQHNSDADLWGAHEVTPDRAPVEQEGSGPWNGTVIIAQRPSMSTFMWLHSDFVESGASYGRVAQIANVSQNRCARRLGSSASVYEMNEACGLLAALSSFHADTKAHEEAHQTSLNDCLASSTALDRQRDLEALVGQGERGSDKLQDEWDDFVDMIRKANEGQVSGDQSSDIWHRAGRTSAGIWLRGSVSTAGHGGTQGC